MAIAKNTAKVAKPVEKAPAKTSAKVADKAPAKTAKAAPAPVVPETKPVVERIGRKDIAAALRLKVFAANAAISPKVAEICAVAYEEVITEALKAGKQVALPGFGIFSSVAKPAAIRPNPQKPGETINVPAHNAPKFKVGSKLKAAVNGGVDVAEEDAGE